MKISYRIFLGFAIILAAGFYFLISWIMSDVKIQPKKSMEESLVDIAHIMASYLEENIRDNTITTDNLSSVMDNALKRKFSSRIYELNKKKVTMGVYVTDKKGIVIYNSNYGQWEGEDFSMKNDIYLTLHGKYGARSSRAIPEDPLTSVAYVGAPIVHKGEIIGVCSVAKPWNSINTFIDTTRNKIIAVGITGFVVALILSFFISRWITRPIRLLTEYADSMKYGIRINLPDLGQGEVKILGDSFEKMKES
ncbi:MAG: hypothetical protein GY757_14590, partial [bacterium]|nr:hypothetical protein [bacterium]